MEGIKEHPLLFKGDMVRAAIRGDKTQTRRVITKRNSLLNGDAWPRGWGLGKVELDAARVDPRPSPGGNPGPYLKVPSFVDLNVMYRLYPRIRAGDNIWIRENWRPRETAGGVDGYEYAADMGFIEIPDTDVAADAWCKYYSRERTGWRPSIHMPRAVSRILLEVTAVRPERIQDISEADAMAEGITADNIKVKFPPAECFRKPTYREAFRVLWEEINAARGYPWENNNYVWVYTFKIKDI